MALDDMAAYLLAAPPSLGIILMKDPFASEDQKAISVSL